MLSKIKKNNTLISVSYEQKHNQIIDHFNHIDQY